MLIIIVALTLLEKQGLFMYSLYNIALNTAAVGIYAGTVAIASSYSGISNPKTAAIYGAGTKLFCRALDSLLLDKGKKNAPLANIIFEEIGLLFVADYCVRSLTPYVTSAANLNSKDVIPLHLATIKITVAGVIALIPLIPVAIKVSDCIKQKNNLSVKNITIEHPCRAPRE